jgi:hypothetical protein
MGLVGFPLEVQSECTSNCLGWGKKFTRIMGIAFVLEGLFFLVLKTDRFDIQTSPYYEVPTVNDDTLALYHCFALRNLVTRT